MQRAQLSAATVEYEDSGGDGPVLVFLTGTTFGDLGVVGLRGVGNG